jgi:deferrochelatase/peroxidase EfeB
MAIAQDLIQGNIIKAFKRPHARYLFLEFQPDAQLVRPRLGALLQRVVTSAARQADITKQWKAEGQHLSREGVGMFGLSFAGYRQLDCAGAPPLSPDLTGGRFEPGMRDQQSALWKPDLTSWDPRYRNNTLEAFLLVCDDDPGRLEQTVGSVKDEVAAFGRVTFEETGARLPAAGGVGDAEPFGFRDGIASIPDLESVFTPEPNGGGFGCFATYAKFEQHIPAFRDAVDAIVQKARNRGLTTTSAEVAALAVGRKPDGTPLAPQGAGGPDDFTFTGVAKDKCPMYAHIRAMNPRNGPAPFQIIRRGIPYPSVPADPARTGLLFLALHRRIRDFIGLSTNSARALDPILTRRSELGWAGDTVKCNGAVSQQWPVGGEQICHPMMDLVTLLGGEFFYIPSMNFIRSLA